MTPEQIANATSDEIVAYVCKKLDQQGVQSVCDGKCLYRGPEGNKCAVGHLIPDDIRVDEATLIDIMEQHSEDLWFLKPHVDLLKKLQYCHDQRWDPKNETFTQAWEGMKRDEV